MRERGQFPAQREKQTFSLLLCSLFHSLSLQEGKTQRREDDNQRRKWKKDKEESALQIKLLDVNMTSLSNSLTHYHTHTPLHRILPFSTVTPKHHDTKSVRNVTSPPPPSTVLTKQPGVQDLDGSGRQVTMLLQTTDFHPPTLLNTPHIRY